jgi:thymidylate kinase
MAIIILEGCDGAGKSTLAEELHRRTGYEIVKGSSFEIAQQGTTAMFDHMMGLLNRNNIIIDRFYMSNFVYGNLYGYPTMSKRQFIELSTAAEAKALTVYLTACPEVLEKRIKNRGDDMVKVERIPKILEYYNNAINRPSTYQASLLTVNSTHYHVKSSAAMIVEFAKMVERQIYMKQDELS